MVYLDRHWTCHDGFMKCGMRLRAGALEAGYEDYQQIREDPDLEAVRADKRFEMLIGKYNRSNSNGFFGNFLKGFQL